MVTIRKTVTFNQKDRDLVLDTLDVTLEKHRPKKGIRITKTLSRHKGPYVQQIRKINTHYKTTDI